MGRGGQKPSPFLAFQSSNPCVHACSFLKYCRKFFIVLFFHSLGHWEISVLSRDSELIEPRLAEVTGPVLFVYSILRPLT